MSIETGLATLLLAQSAITTLVPAQTLGGTSYPAICNEEPTQGMVPPFIVVAITDDAPIVTLDGTNKTGFATVSVRCYHYNKTGADAIQKAVTDFLDDYSGAAGATETINAVFTKGRSYEKLYKADGTDSRQRISSRSFMIQHTEA